MPLQRRLLPDMKVLQTFELAARHGNFTRAGEELALTQSAVSRHVRELEEQIGKPLFERLRGRVVLTRAGTELLPEVQRLLRMAESTMRHATAGAQGESLLAINAPPTFATRWLMPRLPEFLAAHPQLRMDVGTSTGVFDLDSRQCDLALHFGQPLWPGGQCRYLCSEIVLPVAGGALREVAITAPEDLLAQPRLHITPRATMWGDWFARQGMALPDAQGGHWFDEFALSIEAVKAGLGFALLPRYLIEAELARGELTVALDVPHGTDLAWYIVTPEGRADKAAAFSEWLLGQVSFRPLEG
ncbi:LysR family transcriptional regulator [Alloyangia pacifica]|uniref:LysR family transcriptional regulator n=1 Tax=Roseobacteraceae TaxID=2854170 RepID=UPI0013B7660C|nr:LysR family transcriptional regulator [Alloyangia pacifica]MCA0995054.1 LysR family transcriptional regulator [Alloyangia pacifica]NDW02664.1 LysR family transcriptional regulator [Salipiger sp. PrR002]NDW59918.1 LysR family transcriptional regulator [Salipiger sp. PrR004]